MNYSIVLSNLKKNYDDTQALCGLTMNVIAGEMLGLIGPDGAGKTTLLRIICGLLSPSEGECLVDGYNIKSDMRKIRTILGYMPQRFSLYPDLTVAENMRFFADLFNVPVLEQRTRSQRLLEFSRLAPFSKRRAKALSGGMKQKLALSCTLIHTPKILLLDEPTTGVDPLSRIEFWDILQELKSQGVTIVVSTPYMDEASKCDRVAFISEGTILVLERPSSIPSLYHKVLLELYCDQHVRTARLLQDQSDFHSVHIFGNRIHVSGEDEKLMRQKIDGLLKKADMKYTSLQRISASIEDVFVERLKK
jgi:ABC-2 type transport system ATP-binding protein